MKISSSLTILINASTIDKEAISFDTCFFVFTTSNGTPTPCEKEAHIPPARKYFAVKSSGVIGTSRAKEEKSADATIGKHNVANDENMTNLNILF